MEGWCGEAASGVALCCAGGRKRWTGRAGEVCERLLPDAKFVLAVPCSFPLLKEAPLITRLADLCLQICAGAKAGFPFALNRGKRGNFDHVHGVIALNRGKRGTLDHVHGVIALNRGERGTVDHVHGVIAPLV